MLDVYLKSLTFSGGQTVELPREGVTLIVGPNSSGKSQSLRDIERLACEAGADVEGLAVTEVAINKPTDPAEFVQFVTESVPSVDSPQGRRYSTGNGPAFTLDGYRQMWNGYDRLQNIGHVLVALANAEERLQSSWAVDNFDPQKQAAVNPTQMAYDHPYVEREVDALCLEAFGQHAVLDRYVSGIKLRFRIGERPMPEYVDGILTDEFLAKVRSLTPLEGAGDGVRSFLGLALQVIAGKKVILLVDEPEAFLHPPQARILGRALAERVKSGRQLIASTHSADLVLGALDSNVPVSIVRLHRTGNLNVASVLEHSEIRELWNDPQLRYSNVLDGLFHDGVVLCESDGDCRFYSAVIDDVLDEREEQDITRRRRPTILYTHSNGKGGLRKMARALVNAGIRVAVVPDFDILQNNGEFKPLVESLRGNFDTFRSDAATIQAYYNPKDEVKRATLRAMFEAATIDMSDDMPLSTKQVRTVAEKIRVADGWSRSKYQGSEGLPPAETGASSRLLAGLARVGIHIPPGGEMESFIKEVDAHAYDWLDQVFARGLYLDRENHKLRAFARDIIQTIEGES